MSYFLSFPTILYKFGNEIDFNAFQNLSAYVDIIDQVKENASVYTLYEIKPGERPDQLSQIFYGTTDYYWTFFALNDHLKTYGWPIDPEKIPEFVQKKYPNTSVTTRDYFYDEFLVGERVQGTTSGEIGIVEKKISDLGQIIVSGNLNFQNGEELQTIDRDSDDIRSVTIEFSSPEHQSAHHFERSGKWVDIDPTVDLGSEIVPISKIDYYSRLNEERRTIRVFRDTSMREIFTAFNRSLRETPTL